ncbi:hypothetical protein [Shimia ponticola]|uniref:hypothetical protein n=1 Tax=Shimia ponticola TaxID=2582893 RepID=UPI0011BF488D|nr:hypothetical protein [Shimia ponticola]
MSFTKSTSLAEEADPATILHITQLLSKDVREARSIHDLGRRLAMKGYDIVGGFLVTLPHRKRVCPMSRIL